MVTLFKNIHDSGSPHHRSIEVVLQRIKNGKSKTFVEMAMLEPDKDRRNKIKQQLPCICFSGVFTKRNNASLKTHSGFICLDFDDVGTEFKNELKKDEYIFAAFISPSGNGVKALVKIPTGENLNHEASFLSLQKRYPKIDNACKDVARICYESYDPEIYINKDSKIWKEQIVKKFEKVEIDKPITDQDKIYENVKKWLENNNEYFTEGNRNNFLTKISSACNRFGISKETCRNYLIYDFVNGSSNFHLKELDAVLKSIYGRYSHQFGCAQFEKKDIVDRESREVINREILDLESPVEDVIYCNDVIDDMYLQFKNGIKKGEKTGIPKVDEIFRWIKGELTVLYGIGNHGKSQILLDLMMRKSVENGWKWAIFSPEQYPPNRFYNDLIQIYVGKSVRGDSKMSDKEYMEAASFVNTHFYYLYPQNNTPTPEYINSKFFEIIVKHKVDGVVVDPFNQLYHKNRGAREDQYLEDILRQFKNFALRESIVYVVIAHTNGKVEKTDGQLTMPYYIWQLAGGMMWGNKCDNILCYHRPDYQINPKSCLALLESQKIKNQQINGSPGKVELNFNRQTFRFEVEEVFNNPDGTLQKLTVDYGKIRQDIANNDLPF